MTTNSWIKRLLCLLRRSRFERHFKRFTRYVGRLFITGGRAYKKNTYWKISQKQKSYEAYRSSFQQRTIYLTISLGVWFLIDFVRLLFTLMLASIRFMMSNIWSNSRSYKKKEKWSASSSISQITIEYLCDQRTKSNRESNRTHPTRIVE